MTFPHWSRVTLHMSTCVFAECYVFVKQSHGPIHCAGIAAGPLLPKLRGHFAEFLNEVSLARLGMLVTLPPVSVLVRSPCESLEAFLGSPASRASGASPLTVAPRPWAGGFPCRPGPLAWTRHPSGRAASPLLTPSVKTPHGGTGMLTGCPSTTPFGLALGAD